MKPELISSSSIVLLLVRRSLARFGHMISPVSARLLVDDDDDDDDWCFTATFVHKVG